MVGEVEASAAKADIAATKRCMNAGIAIVEIPVLYFDIYTTGSLKRGGYPNSVLLGLE